MPKPDLTVLITDYGDGGVERMLVNTVNGLARAGVHVHYLVGRRDGAYLDAVQRGVEVIEMRAADAGESLTAYLERVRPPRLMTAKLRDDALAVGARRRSGADTRLYFRVGNPLAYRLRQRTWNPLRYGLALRRLRRLYAMGDAAIAISPGVADDLAERIWVPRNRIHLVPNPAVTEELASRALEPVDHPWLQRGANRPVIMGAGGLRQQKDFSTLIRAFARVRAKRDCRLIILGQGRQRSRLLALAGRLGVSSDLDLPGWVSNPHAWLGRASVFALSSRWEGFGNVLVESASLGIPLVATDCPSGPRYILQDGRFGELVPVRDSAAMAAALELVLADPPPPDHVRRAAEPFTLERSARAYMAALGIEAEAANTRNE